MEHPPKQGLKPPLQPTLREWIFCFNGTSTKTRIETKVSSASSFFSCAVLMEHPPKQGLKRKIICWNPETDEYVLMEHPPKQGLKLRNKTHCIGFF